MNAYITDHKDDKVLFRFFIEVSGSMHVIDEWVPDKNIKKVALRY